MGWFKRKKRQEPKRFSIPDFLASLEMRLGQLERRIDEWEKTKATIPAPSPRPQITRVKPRAKPTPKVKPKAKARKAKPRARPKARPAREEEKPVEVTRVKIKKRFKD